VAPDLEELAYAVAAALPSLPHARRLAVAVNRDRASLLGRNWNRGQDCCLVCSPGHDPHWVPLPTGWQPLSDALSAGTGDLVSGQGEMPGGSPWADAPAPDTCAWFLLPLHVSHHLVACVVLETPVLSAEPQHAETSAGLRAVGDALGVVIDLWASAVCGMNDLAQARSEKVSLTRLNRLQGRFVAMASHEFKTPLTSITAYTDVLRSQLTDEQFPHAPEFLDVIKTEADRLLRMVNRILDFTRMEYGSQLLNREATDLEPLVAETLRGLQPTIQDKRLQVEVKAHSHLPRAVVDADLIRQVLVNLLGNAVKFTPPEGLITVTIKEVESAVSISVADNGPGIPAEDVRRIFREFYRADGETAREEGTGLGLTIARHIINLHGGHIEVRRRRSGGADFRFLVPKETGTSNDLPPELELAPSARSGEVRVLLDEMLRLVAELTGSRAVALLLRDGRGALVPASAMGWEVADCKVRPIIENEGWARFMQAGRAVSDLRSLPGELNWCPSSSRLNQYMVAPLGSGDSVLGVIVTGRRREKGDYADVDLAQLTVLADVAKAALHGMNTSVGRTIEAVRLLLKIRRTGVPTSTPVALDLLAKLARRLGVGSLATRRIQYAAALHDAGMARVEEEIIQGGFKLNVDERDEVERHVEQGVDLMAPLLPDEATTDIMRHHHEKFDGTGYPAGLHGEEIPLGSRLLAVIDAWFSLTRDRSYREGLAAEAAMAEIAAHAGTQFDPEVAREFQALLVSEGMLTEQPLSTTPNAN
jgi:signal transduction histidine kinase